MQNCTINGIEVKPGQLWATTNCYVYTIVSIGSGIYPIKAQLDPSAGIVAFTAEGKYLNYSNHELDLVELVLDVK